MNNSQQDFDEPEQTLGITFGLGIDHEAQYAAFMLYSEFGGQEGVTDIAGRDADRKPWWQASDL